MPIPTFGQFKANTSQIRKTTATTAPTSKNLRLRTSINLYDKNLSCLHFTPNTARALIQQPSNR